MRHKIVLLALGLTISLLSYSQTHIPAGNVSGTWTSAASPFIIDGEITVDTFDLLTIEPGVSIEFSDQFGFLVHGRILAQGTETDSIHFFPQDTTLGWYGLSFKGTDYNGQDSSKISYCTLRYGKCLLGSGANDTTGGALFALESSQLSISHSMFERNQAYKGGALHVWYSNILIKNSIFRNNRANSKGGAIKVSYSKLYISNSSIYYNYASMGGGIQTFQDEEGIECEFRNVDIHHNMADYGGGGGILFEYHGQHLIWNNVNIHHNKAPDWVGGGILGRFNVVSCTEVNIHHNEAHKGAGVYYQSQQNNYIANLNIYNNAARFGGGIYFNQCENFIADRLLIYGNTAKMGAGIIVDSTTNVEFRNITMTDNIATDIGGGLRTGDHSNSVFTACILANNVPDEISKYGESEVTAQYSLISGGYPGTEVIDMDPLFTDPANNDYSLSWDDYPDHNETKSPCIDGGDPTFIDPDNTRSDMGAIPYEQTYTPLTFGDLSGTLSCAGSPYYIYGDQTVPLGEELVIEPCVFVGFQGPYKLRVDGRLLAEGTTTNNISFYSADTITGWRGIQFYNQSSNGQDSSILNNCRIMYGKTDTYANGGAILLSNSSELRIENCLIAKNHTDNNGGAIYGYNSHPLLKNNSIINNSAKQGGAIYSYSCKLIINGGTIENNNAESGGGLYFLGNDPELYGVTIRNNFASKFGGGIYFNGNVNAVFGSSNRCSIYDNYAIMAGTDICGMELYPSVTIDLNVNLFTVLNADDHFIHPKEKFNVDTYSGVHAQFSSDLYVSPTGNDNNSGTTASSPLKTISRALLTIEPDLTDTFNIHLAEGTYSNSITDEKFPLNFRSGIALAGNEGETIILDGDDTTNFFYFYDDSRCLITRLQMQNGFSEYGGALHIEYHSTPLLQYIKIKDCESTLDGGAIYIKEESYPTIHSANFRNNTGQYGGAINCYSSSASLYNVGFTNNTGYEGGAICASHGEYVKIELGYFDNNKANTGGACEFYRIDTVKINNTIFEKNAATSQYGGAMYLQESDVQITNSKLSSNRAAWCGGAIGFYHNVNLSLNNVRVTNDTAAYGGGIYGSLWSSMALRNVVMYGNYAEGNSSFYGEGGAMYLSGIETDIINSTITNNEALDEGGALYNKMGNINFKNSILWSNTPDEIYLESGTATAEYSDIQGGYAGAGNLNINPEFYDVVENDFSLKGISQCIDAGTPDTSGLSLPDKCLAGNPRIGNGVIDMGAYEYFERKELALSVFLEGPFNGVDMDTEIAVLIDFPLTQPYFQSPWNYLGSESLTSTPGPDVVDWILIELRDAANAALATNEKIISSFAGLLLSDGSVVSTNGTSNIQFFDIAEEQLFVTIKHRNHLGLISASPLNESGGIFSYNFTYSSGQAYGTSAQKNLGTGVFGMFAGDADANETIELQDKSIIWQNESGQHGYLNGDFNLDSQVNNQDKNDILINNIGISSQIPN